MNRIYLRGDVKATFPELSLPQEMLRVKKVSSLEKREGLEGSTIDFFFFLEIRLPYYCFLVGCMCACIMSDSLQPMDYRPPGSSVHGIF